MSSRLENEYQAKLIKKIKLLLPGCMVLKNDSGYMQGIPDLSIFYGNQWATLEVKKSYKDYLANDIPNQDWYVDQMNAMSYSAFIYPENEEEILNELQQAFQPARSARLSKR